MVVGECLGTGIPLQERDGIQSKRDSKTQGWYKGNEWQAALFIKLIRSLSKTLKFKGWWWKKTCP